ncbi:phospholipase D-like domain-containing protein [Vibrio maritimus]|uniref:phospholipase D-like domain-containing protein n=1 Tax=Vibrio maritimus TaxID=990268 RepID=UPI001F44463F|nr:phospholipase D family protein [Vibrio maritimus]
MMKYLFLAAVIASALGCVTKPQHYHHTSGSIRVNKQAESDIASVIKMARRSQPSEQSGFRLLNDPVDALVTRAALISRAEHSVDIQYYIYKNDFSGALLLDEAKKAAERGVRVRILLDDFGSFGIDDVLITLDQHPNIEVRLFNAFRRNRTLIGQLTFGLGHTTRRMHNKALIIDNQVAIVGGRNIGDEYFGANPDIVFEDIDVLLTNPATNQISTSFDEFWNHERAKPASSLIRKVPLDKDIIAKTRSLKSASKIPETKNYIEAVSQKLADAKRDREELQLSWAFSEVKYDSPSKVTVARDRYDLMWSSQVSHMVDELEHQLTIVTPYFVPSKKGMNFFADLRRRGIQVTVITNSLKSTDVAIVHSGYSKYRKQLLDMGVTLYEIDGREKQKLDKDSLNAWFASRSSLHAKLFIFDQNTVFIGSPNFDPRSFYENTEIGVSIHSPELAIELNQALEDVVTVNAFRVTVDAHGGLMWTKGEERFDKEPGASWWKRTSNYLMRFLPVESQL